VLAADTQMNSASQFDFGAARAAMVHSQLQPNGISDPAVVRAFATVERERFAGGGNAMLAYVEAPLPVGGGRALMAPMTLGYMLQRLMLTGSERVLVVGCATGYSAAVIAMLGCDVTALEENPELAAAARAASQSYSVVEGPLTEGWAAAAPYDVILVDGRIEALPAGFAAQLAEGGRVVAIVLGEDGVQRVSIAVKTGLRLVFDPVIEAAAPALPGFRRKPAFRF
jgi:protein-L-isoaspartate(D-aspartate) O-methyltransferase